MSSAGAPPCSELSRELHEPLAGTAPEHTALTLLVPHRGAIAREPIESEGLLVPRPFLEDALAAAPGRRLHLFLRELGSPFFDSILVARTERDARSLHRFDLSAVTSADALLAMLAEPETGEPVEGPLHVVCVHGRRDACCARLGTALYRAFRALAGERVLRASHLGGHRFAPIVHTYPQGFCFGRVGEEHLEALDEAAARGEVAHPSLLRGVFPYDAAEHAALVRYLEEGGALTGARVSREGERVRVDGPSLSRVYRVKREALAPRPLSCGAAPGEVSRLVVRGADERETR